MKNPLATCFSLAVLLFLFVAFIHPSALVAQDTASEIGADESVPNARFFLDYYVSANKKRRFGIGSRRSPFKTITEAAKAVKKHQSQNRGAPYKYKVWVAPGEYKEEVLLTTGIKNVVFEGCQQNFEPIDPATYNYKLGDALDETRMPLLNGESARSFGFRLDHRNVNVAVRNFQIEKYLGVGAYIYSPNIKPRNITFENIVVTSVTGRDPKSFGGSGIVCAGNRNIVRHCVVGNSWGTNISINGNNNLIEHCQSYCFWEDGSPNNGTDYYLVVNGNENRVASCELRREGNPPHNGHGFTTYGGSNNHFSQCKSFGISEGIFLSSVNNRGPEIVENNTYRDCTIKRGSIHLSTEANRNNFINCLIDGQGVISGVTFRRTNRAPDGSEKPASGNVFRKCEFRNSRNSIVFHYHHFENVSDVWEAPASNNEFRECTFRDSYVLAQTYRPNLNTRFINSKFQRVLHFHSDDGAPFSNPQFDHCEFIDNGFPTPPGLGNITMDSDPLFPPDGDIHSGLVAHWTFDETGNTDVAKDSSGDLNGQLRDGANWDREGKLGGCIRLGKSGYVRIGDKLDLDRSNMSIAAWIRADNWKGNSGIVSKYGNYRFGFGQTKPANLLSAAVGGGGQPINAVSTRKSPLVIDRWYHVAVVFDSAKGKSSLYIDGILRTSDELTTKRTDRGSALEIGRYIKSTFDGRIDDVRIYNRALASEDVVSIAALQQ